MPQTRSFGEKHNQKTDIKAIRSTLIAEVHELMEIMLQLYITVGDQNREITCNDRKMDNYINLNEEKVCDLVKRLNTLQTTSVQSDLTSLKVTVTENNQHSYTNTASNIQGDDIQFEIKHDKVRKGIIDEIFDRFFAKVDEILTSIAWLDSMLTGNAQIQEDIQRSATEVEILNNDQMRTDICRNNVSDHRPEIQKGNIVVVPSEDNDFNDNEMEKIDITMNAECRTECNDLKR